MSKTKFNYLSPTEQIMSVGMQAQTEEKSETVINEKLPRGKKIVDESKSIRLQLLIKPSTKDILKNIAISQRTSLNNLINTILENYIDQE